MEKALFIMWSNCSRFGSLFSRFGSLRFVRTKSNKAIICLRANLIKFQVDQILARLATLKRKERKTHCPAMKLTLAFLALVGATKSNGASATTCFEPNLGSSLSEATGYSQEYPSLGGYSTPAGYDDTIAFLVGGNYNAPVAAEIEGRAVVLGDFTIGSQGTNSIGK